MKIPAFETVKKELNSRRENTKYFTKDFYNTYLKALQTGLRIDEEGKDDSYKKGGITLRHRYDEIYTSKFYQLNSGCYCEFLSVMCGLL